MTRGDQGAARTGPGVNAGYQRDDRDIVDYHLWQIGDQQARGPNVAVDRPFGVALGAAQVFGRFVQRPFPAQLADSLRVPVLNLGFSGSGPSFFLQRPELIDTANRARFAVVHLMSGRSVSNSRVIIDRNQGQALLRSEPERPPIYAEDIYKSLMATMSIADLAALRVEIRSNYVAEMRALLDRITVPKILLYWAKRPVNYAENLRGIAGFWGDFPHFVNRDVVDLIRPHADDYVEVISDRGLPQPLYNHATGDPIEVWPADRFPGIQLRDHNYYYPSPEMNDDAARALVPACARMLDRAEGMAWPPKPSIGRRQLLAHVDIFCNATASITRSLRESFGPQLVNGEGLGHSAEEVSATLAGNEGITALTSPRWRFELADGLDADVHPLVVLRHPLLRAKALYTFEHGENRQRDSSSAHTRAAAGRTLAEWLEWCLAEPARAAPIANYQTRLCGRAASGLLDEDWARPVTLAMFEEAMANLATASVGTVEALAHSMTRIETDLRPIFPTLRLLAYESAALHLSADAIAHDTTALCQEIGEVLFAHLASANAFDLLLYRHASTPATSAG